jgi:phenylpropionate dioxygenase-like ring-hydroxylating dioxygenase large terminal subunit
LGPFAEDLASLGLRDHVVRASQTVERNLNWKLAIELFLESYHVQRVHKCLDPKRFLNNVVALDFHGPHVRYATARTSLLSVMEGTRKARLREVSSLVYLFFPNTLMLVESNYVGVATYLPVGVDRTMARLFMLVPGDDARPAEYWERNAELFFQVHDEDFTVGESIQRGLRSGANEHLVFGRFEHALKRFQESVTAAITPA